MGTMKDTKMQPATDAVINELRMLAEDLDLNGYSGYSSALLKAADELECLRAKIEQMEKQEPVAWARKLGMDLPSLGCVTDLKYRPSDMPESAYMPLYALPGAQGEER